MSNFTRKLLIFSCFLFTGFCFWKADPGLVGGADAAMLPSAQAVLSPAVTPPRAVIQLNMPEMYVVGAAEVLSISDCPPIDPGDGPVVISTFKNVSHNVLNIYVEGETEPIGVTAGHPIWSEDRQAFIHSDQLQPGERLRSAVGKTVRITSIEIRAGPEPVYNLEVAGEHVYSVTNSGLLVHNVSDCNLVTKIGLPDGSYIDLNAPRVGNVVAQTAEEASFLRNVQRTFGDDSVFTGATRHRGNIVIQRNDIDTSIENLMLMQGGNTPFARNAAGEWEKLNLHHVGRQDGMMIEIISSHNAYNPTTGGVLHISGPGGPVRQSRLSITYWQQRLEDMIDAGLVSPELLRELGG
ncbi:polymorphic toxin-type HINT domain-containing protein [Gimesia maris]|uniref:polymorphic toxin-type HINT domain-containing protein n=1 Tax=Gimesia maris TaxID=122 RepID=UPI001E623ABD|nr:polymorphic toxin-type HINT domain-containing protein [Gimesia maris]